MLPGESILGITAAGFGHLVEGHDAVSRLELGHIVTDGLDNACNVVALIASLVQPFWEFPIRDLSVRIVVIVTLARW
jgi:hypothetical protein